MNDPGSPDTTDGYGDIVFSDVQDHVEEDEHAVTLEIVRDRASDLS